jgi:hypothetical protein
MINFAESLECVPHGESCKCSEGQRSDVINSVASGEHTALSPHFSCFRDRGFFNVPGPVSDEQYDCSCNLIASENQSACIVPDEESRENVALRTRVDAIALRGLDVEIAVREAELATMKRARAVLVLARDAGVDAATRSESRRAVRGRSSARRKQIEI